LDLISRGLLSSLNYGPQGECYRSIFAKSYNQMFELFTKYRVRGEGTGSFYLPKIWAPSVYGTMRKMVSIDPNIKFTSASEKYGKLCIGFILSDKEFEQEISDLMYKAQIRIDNINHGLVSRFLDKNPQMRSTIGDEKWLLIKGVLHIGN